ncbi:hypothetical protein JCM11641_004134 [Rhodosporidiobolus odoratus]
MDDDVMSLHGVASDSGYASSTFRSRESRSNRSHATVTSSRSTGSLNARFDRLSREMEQVAGASRDGSAEGAGRSLGIRRKSIMPGKVRRPELGGIEERASWARQPDEEKTPKKRRYSLLPAQAQRWRNHSNERRGTSTKVGATDAQPPVRLKKVLSPHSGKSRTVVVERDSPALDDHPSYLATSMELPSFMREEQPDLPAAKRSYTPQPEWMSRYLTNTPANLTPPARPTSIAYPQPYSPSPQSSLPLPPFEEHHYYAPPSPDVTAEEPTYPTLQPSLHAISSTPLPFSTSGRPAYSTPQILPPRQAQPKQALYEVQLSRPAHAFGLVTPPVFEKNPAFHRYSPQPYYSPAYVDPGGSEQAQSTLQLPHNPSPVFVESGLPNLAHTFQASQPYPPQAALYTPRIAELDYEKPPAQWPLQPFSQGQQAFYPTEHQGPSSGSYNLLHDASSPPYLIESDSCSPQCVTLDPRLEKQEVETTPASNFWKHRPLPHLQNQIQPSLRPGQLRFAERLKAEAASQVAPPDEMPSYPALPQTATRTFELLPPSSSAFPLSLRPVPHRIVETSPPANPLRLARQTLADQEAQHTPLRPTTAHTTSPRRRPRSSRRMLDLEEVGSTGAATRAARSPGLRAAPRLPDPRVVRLSGRSGDTKRGREESPSPRASQEKKEADGENEFQKQEADEGGRLEGRNGDDTNGQDVEYARQEDSARKRETVRFDWDVVMEGEKLLQAALSSEEQYEVSRDGEVDGQDEGEEPGFTFYEDPKEPVEE